MNNLYIVERKIEDSHGKYDVDIFLVSAENGNSAVEKVYAMVTGKKVGEQNFSEEKKDDRITYGTRLLSQKEVIISSTIPFDPIVVGTKVIDRNFPK